MQKEFWKGGTLLSPLPPALVSLGEPDNANIITIGWTGIINSDPPMTYISVRPERYSFEILNKTKEFVINLPTQRLVRAADWCGVKSGRDFDKFKEMGLTKTPCKEISTVQIDESPIALECRVREIIPFGTHHMFMADILGVNVDKSVIDENGRLLIEKCDLICYAHGTYFALGEKLGTFGFSVRKKPVKKAVPKKKKRN